jgi:hypothetical protein
MSLPRSQIKVNEIVHSDNNQGPTLSMGATCSSGQIFSCLGGVSVTGIVTANSFEGDGSSLTNLSTITAARTFALSIILDPLPFRV